MNIIETNIPDVDISSIDQAKVKLANKIIRNVYPLFDEVHSDKVTRIKTAQRQLKEKRQQVGEQKNLLQGLVDEYSRKKKIKKLLDRLSKLVSSGLVYDGSLRTETIVLLKVIDKLPEDKLDFHLRDSMKNITKRFGSHSNI